MKRIEGEQNIIGALYQRCGTLTDPSTVRGLALPEEVNIYRRAQEQTKQLVDRDSIVALLDSCESLPAGAKVIKTNPDGSRIIELLNTS